MYLKIKKTKKNARKILKILKVNLKNAEENQNHILFSFTERYK